MIRSSLAILLFVAAAHLPPVPVSAQCPTEPQLQSYSGSGSVACACFVPGEEAGAVFTLPAAELPIEILRVGIGYGSQFGGSPPVLEDAINIYEGGLPDPGAPIFSLAGPELVDGVINDFDLEPLPGEIVVGSSPFTVTLTFFNQTSGDPFAPTTVHDGNGCQLGKNVVKAVPGGWLDACLVGLTGDWVFYVIYRRLDCAGAGRVPDGRTVAGQQLVLGRGGGGTLNLSWGGSCSPAADDYAVYEGVQGFYYSHVSRLCSTSGATSAAVDPPGLSTYYLVVPHGGSEEGSYGSDSGDVERPTGGNACHSQASTACP